MSRKVAARIISVLSSVGVELPDIWDQAIYLYFNHNANQISLSLPIWCLPSQDLPRRRSSPGPAQPAGRTPAARQVSPGPNSKMKSTLIPAPGVCPEGRGRSAESAFSCRRCRRSPPRTGSTVGTFQTPTSSAFSLVGPLIYVYFPAVEKCGGHHPTCPALAGNWLPPVSP